MSLKLMYITNNPDVAVIAKNAGVDRIFLDMEYIGKRLRQKNPDAVINCHKIVDIKTIKRAVGDSCEILVRVNPIHRGVYGFLDSEQEISSAIEAGADLIMLPYFKTINEVKTFLLYVGERAKTVLLVETIEAVELLDEILKLPGIDEIHIGLNDLSLSCKKKFLFQLLADGTVEKIVEKIKKSGIPYGFGGIARIGHGDVPAEYILGEHIRLGSSMVILSKSFANASTVSDYDMLTKLFADGVRKIRRCETMFESESQPELEQNRIEFVKLVEEHVKKM